MAGPRINSAPEGVGTPLRPTPDAFRVSTLPIKGREAEERAYSPSPVYSAQALARSWAT